jgi:hypothetical protein
MRMKTYQDLLEIGEDEADRMEFVRAVINEHKQSDLYKTAYVADLYNRHKNKTINEYQKLIYDMAGMAHVDIWSANHKMGSRFFNRFITQENQYLLGNGVGWKNSSTGKKLGDEFDTEMQKLGDMALWGAVSFGFYNMDHVEGFSVLEFAPLYDEENGALMAGVRFWQVSEDKPLRATLYEIDGYTDYIWGKKDLLKNSITDEILHDKRAYKLKIRASEADGEEIYDGENYPGFPIVPLWGNPSHQSEIVGLQEQIDCYDLIKSGYANNVDEGSIIYWTLNNAGGMGDIDLARWLEKMRTMHAAALDDDVTAEPHTVESPYQSRDSLLEKLREDLYEDAMALDTKNIASGAVTATQIRAAYEPLNAKVDQYEYCVREFLKDLLAIAGIDDEPTFTRSMIVNSQEEIQLVLQSAQYLSEDYVTEKILTLLGDGDLAEDMLKQKEADELDRAFEPEEEVVEEPKEEPEEIDGEEGQRA